ncbi:Rho GTPase activation protein [Pilobolus umbonatus]|nr:Rho GTPase activation protein [Pilobolus umbonatus]
MQSAREVAFFLKKRADIEEEYGKKMIKLAQSTNEAYERTHPDPKTFGTTWLSFLKVHEKIGEQRVKFATDIVEVADDVHIMCKDIEKSRKQIKETGNKHERTRLDSELALDKCKQKYYTSSEEWEKAILVRNNGDGDHYPKKGLFKSNKSPAQLKKLVDDSCTKADQAHSLYKHQLVTTNATRHDYFNSQLPSDLITLKSVDDECCAAIKYQLARYGYIYEKSLVADGYALDNDDGLGLRSLTQKIDYRLDMDDAVRDYTEKAMLFNKSDIPYREYAMSPAAINILKPNPVFGVDLTRLMQRDKQEVPMIVKKCAEAIEAHGLRTVGIYRVSGTSTQIHRLKNEFDRDCASVDLNTEENLSDINNITSVLKLWFRELPDSLFPRSSYEQFMKAAKIENDRMRVLGLHTVINDLPDAHYATMKYIMKHLYNVQQNQEFNKMTSANLSTIFSMTLIAGDQNTSITSQDSHRLADTQWQVKVIQTILEKYHLIFELEE